MRIGNVIIMEIMKSILPFEEFAGHLSDRHPRLFLTPETIPQLRERSAGVCRQYTDSYAAHIAALPDPARLEFKTDVAEMRDGKLFFKKLLNDQNAAVYAVERTGGVEAFHCALLFRVTGDRAYLRRARQFLAMLVEFVRWSDRCQVLPEWYNNSRLCALVAYDWLYDELSVEERRAFLLPILAHIEFMQNPGYAHNGGGPCSGNYGEPALQWFAGLVAWRDGIDDERAERLLRAGYALHVEMMELREKVSGGTGLLSSLSSCYSLGAYPHAGFWFLHSLRSAAGLDAAPFWTQMRDYAHWVSWALIPDSRAKSGFLEYGWGDSFHLDGEVDSLLLYTHLAQALHFWGENAQTRAMIERIPARHRKLNGADSYPFLPYLLTGFQENAPENAATPVADELGAHFPSFGLTVMRSGTGPSDTYAAFRAGAKYEQHQHYDELSFILYKRGFLALDSGTRGQAQHHLAYFPQSVAHNTLLIRMPDEELPYYWYPQNAPPFTEKTRLDGGQNKFCGGCSFPFEKSSFHVATGGDSTGCYSPAKCREAARQLVWIAPDYFILYDRVQTTHPEYGKVFLLHTQNEPRRLTDGVWRSEAGEGVLFADFLLPEGAGFCCIGGAGAEFVSDNKNWPLPADRRQEPNWLGRYRLEATAPDGECTRFLTVLQTAERGSERHVAVNCEQDETYDRACFTTCDGKEVRVGFRRSGAFGYCLEIQQKGAIVYECETTF